MALSKKKEDELVKKAVAVIDRWKTWWDTKLYKAYFPDFRRMAEGKLPKKIEDDLKQTKYKRHSKLVPRLIPDSIDDMTSKLFNSLFNREKIFDFVGRINPEDHDQAADARNVVQYDWDFEFSDSLKAKMELRKAIKDSVTVGGGFVERQHTVERVLSPRYVGGEYKANHFDVVYVGPKWVWIRTEMIYLDPTTRIFEKRSGYIKLLMTSISSIKKEGVEGGLYHGYKKNIKNIERGDYDENIEEAYDTGDDHRASADADEAPDFKVLLAEWWTSVDPLKEVLTEHVVTIANPWNKPQLLRYGRDPMQTGKDPLRMCIVYPREDRVFGNCLPEMLKDYMLEMAYKQNQRINLINKAAAVGGTIFGNISQLFGKNTVLADFGNIVNTRGSDVKDIRIDLSAYQFLMIEEDRIAKKADKTAATNPVTAGLEASRRETATTTATIDQNAKRRTNDPIGMVEDTLIKPCAKDTLLHEFLLGEESKWIRVLGQDRKWIFKNIKREDILGNYDVVCHASSEIIPEAIRLANMNSMAQMYLNSSLDYDRQEFGRQHFKMAEIPGADRMVSDITLEQERVERENGMLADGVPVVPIEKENHSFHVIGHMKAAQEFGGLEPDPADPIMLNFERHIQIHLQMQAALSGQQGGLTVGNVPQQPSFDNMGDLLSRVGTDNRTRLGG